MENMKTQEENPFEITATQRYSLNEFIHIIYSNIDRSQIVDFIQRLELKYGDWDITEDLYEYFCAQHEIYLKEIGEHCE